MIARIRGNVLLRHAGGLDLAMLIFFNRSKERRSEADTEPQLRLVPLEIDKIERARACGHGAPDLNAPRRRHEVTLAEGRIKGRADVKRLPSETVEAEPVVVAKIARLRANKDVRHYLHRERRSQPERRFAESLCGPAQACLFRFVAKIDRGE